MVVAQLFDDSVWKGLFVRCHPPNLVSTMRDKVRRKSIFFLSHVHDFGQTGWVPHIDIYRSLENWLIKCDLSGVRVEDIAVEARNSTLLITGVRRDLVAEEGWEHYSMEIPYGKFELSVTMPRNVERAGIVLEFREGMLLIQVRFDEENR